MLNSNNKLKSFLLLTAVIGFSFASFYTTILLTKKYTSKEEVIYSYWDAFEFNDISFNGGVLNLVIKDSKDRYYNLISDENCDFDVKNIPNIKDKKIMLEISVVNSSDIFKTTRKEILRFADEAKNHLCDKNYKTHIR